MKLCSIDILLSRAHIESKIPEFPAITDLAEVISRVEEGKKKSNPGYKRFNYHYLNLPHHFPGKNYYKESY